MKTDPPRVFEVADFRNMIDNVASVIQADLSRRLACAGRATLLLSGGRTPGPIYSSLASANIHWCNVRIMLADDRVVPPSSSFSNEKLIRNTLLKDEAATAEYVPIRQGKLNQSLLPFTVAVLGIGGDGHIASLFGTTDQLGSALDPQAEPECIAVCPEPLPRNAPFPRLSLNLGALLRSESVVFLLTGEKKRQIFNQAVAGRLSETALGTFVSHCTGVMKAFWTPEEYSRPVIDAATG